MSLKPTSPVALNNLPTAKAQALLQACCGSTRYAKAVLAHRPYASEDHLQEASRHAWNNLSQDSWQATFRSHTRLGTSRREEGLAARWTRREQKVLSDTGEELLRELRGLETRYRNKHGFPFVVCFDGRTVVQLKEELKTRLAHETDQEVFEAAEEQMRITERRLRKALVEAKTM